MLPGTTSARKVLRVDLGDHKDALEAFCKAEGITVSQFVRSTLLEAMGQQPVEPRLASKSAALRKPARHEGERLEYVVSPEDKVLLVQRADVAGFMSLRGYVSALVRAHITGRPQLGNPELQALVTSTAQVTSLVQKLRSGCAVPYGLEEQVRTHLSEVRQLIQANARRWGA